MDNKRRTNKKIQNKKQINKKQHHRNAKKNNFKKNNNVSSIKRAKRGTKAKATRQKINKEKLKKNIDKRVKIVSNNITGFKIPTFIYFVAAYIFFGVFLMLTLFSKVEKLNKDILTMQNDKQVLMEEKRHLEIMLDSSYNISKIKEITERNLNMKKPEEHQIIYIDIPNESSVNYSSNYEQKNVFFNIFNKR